MFLVEKLKYFWACVDRTHLIYVIYDADPARAFIRASYIDANLIPDECTDLRTTAVTTL